MKFLYTGASTACKAFVTNDGNDEMSKLISMGKLFSAYTDYELVDESSYGKPNHWLIDEINRKGYSKELPIYWLYGDPLMGLFFDGDRTFPDIPEKNSDIFYECVTGDWKKVFYEVADRELEYLNSFGYKIGFVASSGDIEPWQVENYENLTVIDSSWSTPVAEKCNTNYTKPYLNSHLLHQAINWFFPEALSINIWQELWCNDPAELKGHPKISPLIVDKIYEIYRVREDMEKAGYFTHIHPNLESNLMYHNIVKDKVKTWMDVILNDS